MNEEIILTKEQLGKFIDFLEKEKKSVVDPEALKGLKKLFSSLKDGDSIFANDVLVLVDRGGEVDRL